jgi:hypothetical protein
MGKLIVFFSLAMGLAFFSFTASAAEDLSDMTKPYTSAVRSADDGGMEAIAGWHQRQYMVDGNSGWCVSMNGNQRVTRGQWCPQSIIWDQVARTENVHKFGPSSCPMNGTTLTFNAGYKRANGSMISGPATICMRVN